MFGRRMRRGGRPGLLGTVARTAVVAGTATVVSGAVRGHQQNKAQEQADAEAYQAEQAAPPPPAPAPQPAPVYAAPPPAEIAPAAGGVTDDLIEKLQQLGKLKADGILTEEEFAGEKAKLLNG